MPEAIYHKMVNPAYVVTLHIEWGFFIFRSPLQVCPRPYEPAFIIVC